MKQVFLLGETLSKMRQNKITPREELKHFTGFLVLISITYQINK